MAKPFLWETRAVQRRAIFSDAPRLLKFEDGLL